MLIPGYEPSISIIIPCFNEAGNAELVVTRLAELRSEVNIPFEAIFVDGCSNDGTPERLRTAIAEHSMEQIVSVHVMSSKRGYGYDIMHGLRQARSNVLSWTHADMQTDIKDVFTAYDRLKALEFQCEKVFVKGKRLNRPIVDAIFTFGMQLFTLAAIRVNLHDINAQPKVFTRAFFDNHLSKGAPNDFSLDLFALFHAKIRGYQIETIPVYFRARQFGEAKGGGGGLKLRFALIRRTTKYILKLSSQRFKT